MASRQRSRRRSIYAAKRAELVAGLEPLLARGWSWSSNPAGFHLLIRHPDRELVRKTAARSGLDLALLSGYRIRRRADDGLFLRFGGLPTAELRTAIPELLRALTSIHVGVHGMPRTPP
jgi:DNA-binding transcriptional MocR family regulator